MPRSMPKDDLQLHKKEQSLYHCSLNHLSLKILKTYLHFERLFDKQTNFHLSCTERLCLVNTTLLGDSLLVKPYKVVLTKLN